MKRGVGMTIFVSLIKRCVNVFVGICQNVEYKILAFFSIIQNFDFIVSEIAVVGLCGAVKI